MLFRSFKDAQSAVTKLFDSKITLIMHNGKFDIQAALSSKLASSQPPEAQGEVPHLQQGAALRQGRGGPVGQGKAPAAPLRFLPAPPGEEPAPTELAHPQDPLATEDDDRNEQDREDHSAPATPCP